MARINAAAFGIRNADRFSALLRAAETAEAQRIDAAAQLAADRPNLADAIASLFGQPADPYGVACDRLAAFAGRTGECCGMCAVDLAPSDEVYRQRVRGSRPSGPGRMTTVCAACAARHQYWYRRPCASCGRAVRFAEQRAEYVTCCGDHAAKARNVRRRQSARRAECAGCAQPVPAGRSDLRYCSNACRQRAYRARRV